MLDFFPKQSIGYSPFGAWTWGRLASRGAWMGHVLAHVMHDVLHGWERENYACLLSPIKGRGLSYRLTCISGMLFIDGAT